MRIMLKRSVSQSYFNPIAAATGKILCLMSGVTIIILIFITETGSIYNFTFSSSSNLVLIYSNLTNEEMIRQIRTF